MNTHNVRKRKDPSVASKVDSLTWKGKQAGTSIHRITPQKMHQL